MKRQQQGLILVLVIGYYIASFSMFVRVTRAGMLLLLLL